MENGAVLRYTIFYPGGNTTALVEAPKGNGLASIAKRIMETDPAIEQVGFLFPSASSAFKLQMMGGEFCVNAARCAAHQWFSVNSGDEVEFEVSGLSSPVKARLEDMVIHLHLPSSLIKSISEIPEGHLVNMEGISFIVSDSVTVDSRDIVTKFSESNPAVGVIKVSSEDGIFSIEADVWVKETDTFISETGCGSGSIAAYLACHGVGKKGFVQQPSGYDYAIDVRSENEIVISGIIEDKGEGEVLMTLEREYAASV
jgi:diaminopimelate epimerase